MTDDRFEVHPYPWRMLRENLTSSLETGETPIHEPAIAPEPDRHVGWDCARRYVDAPLDAAFDERLDVDAYRRCGPRFAKRRKQGDLCQRCDTPLRSQRLLYALVDAGFSPEVASPTLLVAGLSHRTGEPPA